MFEMGPRARASSADRRDQFERGHCLGKENAVNQGMPWTQPNMQDDALLPKARRHTLHHERMEADQDLEWVPTGCQKGAKGDRDSENRSHARVNIYAREVGSASQALEMAPMVQAGLFMAQAAAAVGPKYHGRRNILSRETAEDSTDAPIASGYGGDGVPTYARKSMLPPYVPREPLAAN